MRPLTLRYPVVLASVSPRRRELLAQVVEQFEVVAPGVDESVQEAYSPAELVEALAAEKARAVAPMRPEAILIGADTTVALDDSEQLGKPGSTDEAVEMLQRLSGREHKVYTGVCVAAPGAGEEVFSAVTRVVFRPLSQDEIERYVATGEPMDKAGAYAIQGGASEFVESIDGAWSTVVGLPIELLRVRLAKFV